MKQKLQPYLSNPYLPGILFFLFALVVGLCTYRDYGIAWDEPAQREPAILSYNYIFYGSQDLFIKPSDNHGAGFELLLVFIEKWFKLKDLNDVYQMRHIVTHIFFLISVFFGYVLAMRLFKDRFIASLAFIMLAFSPRLYAHSFFNSKDIPFFCMFIVALAVCQMAFEKDKTWLFFVLGLVCGYGTSIRIMGIMLGGFIGLFLLIDFIKGFLEKRKSVKPLLHLGVFMVGFCVILYAAWPYIWKHPVQKFIESYTKMASYDWKIWVLISGKLVYCTKLAWTYFPTWFLISNPELWLIAGFGGIILIAAGIIKNPLAFVYNSNNRNFVLFLLCFFFPILAVIILHSVIYDDWRHLYFVYPPFVFMGLYFINWLYQTKYKKIVQGVCLAQVLAVGWFMLQNHPFQQVYFNNLVSHDEEYLRKNYDMDYWGCAFKQGLFHLAEADTSRNIKICTEYTTMLNNNILTLPMEDRGRFSFAQFEQADYYMSSFRLHPEDYPGKNIEYEIQVLNSTIMRVYKLKNTPQIKLR